MKKLNGLSLIRLRRAIRFLCEVKRSGGNIVFVSTHHITRSIIKQIAKSCNSYYVIEDWIKGFLTKKILFSDFINKNHLIERSVENQQIELITKGVEKGNVNLVNNKIKFYKGIDLNTRDRDNIYVTDLYNWHQLNESGLQSNLENLNLKANSLQSNTIGAIVLLDTDNILKRVILKEALKVSIPVVSIINNDEDITNVTYPISYLHFDINNLSQNGFTNVLGISRKSKRLNNSINYSLLNIILYGYFISRNLKNL